MVLWKFTLRELKNRPGRATLTLLSIVIAVSAVVAVKVSTATTRAAYQDMYVSLTGHSDLEVVPDGEGYFPQALADKLQDVAGVKAVAPSLQLPWLVRFKNSPNSTQVAVMGIDPARDEAVRDYVLAEGDFFHGDEGALLEMGFARALGVHVGDDVSIQPKRLAAPQHIKVVGLLTPQGIAGFRQGTAVILPLRTVQQLVGQGSVVNNASLVLDPKADVAKVQQAVAAMLPPGLTAKLPMTRAQSADETLATLDQGLNFAYLLTLVLATIVILNTFLMNVGERRRQLAILRAIGTTRWQVMGMLLREGAFMGAVGTILGLTFGLAGAYGLSVTMAKAYSTSMSTLQVGVEPFILAAILGPGMAMFAMFVPAYLAGKVTPLEGMRPMVVQAGRRVSPLFTIFGIIGFVVTGGGLVASILGYLPLSLSTPLGVAYTVSLILLIPVVLNPLSALCAAVLRPIFRTEAKLAHRQVVRRRTRSTLTVGVLYVSLSAGIGLGTAILNNVEDVRTWQKKTFIGDFFVRATLPDLATGSTVPMPDAMLDQLRTIKGITSVDPLRLVQGVTIRPASQGANATSEQKVATVLRDFGADNNLPLDLKIGDPQETCARLRKGEVVIATVVAHRMGLSVGDEIVLQTRQGPQKLRIAGEANDYWAGGLSMYIDRALGRKLLQADGADIYIVHSQATALASVGQELDTICKREGLLLQSFADLRRRIDNMMKGVIAGLWGIMALGLVVAGFAVANTLTMNVLEQTREIAMLRVVAMTRHQVRKTILAQAAILGLFGVTLGVIAGMIASYTMNLCIPAVTGRPIEFVLDPSLLIGTYVVALVIVLIAAWLPARRATHMDLLIALQYE